jgi:hypothetical protein
VRRGTSGGRCHSVRLTFQHFFTEQATASPVAFLFSSVVNQPKENNVNTFAPSPAIDSLLPVAQRPDVVFERGEGAYCSQR